MPDYAEATSIADLAAAGDAFGERIHGIDPGAGIMALTERAMGAYGLDEWRLIAGSDAAMSKTLASAMGRQEPIVVTAWAPHPVFSSRSLRYLEDPRASTPGTSASTP